MVERRSRRPASSRRPRVAGHRKRGTQGQDAQHQDSSAQQPDEVRTSAEGAADSTEVEDRPGADASAEGAASGAPVEDSASEESAAEESASEGASEQSASENSALEQSAREESAGEESARDENTQEGDPTDVGVFGDADTSEADTRSLVVRDGRVEFGETESGTSDEDETTGVETAESGTEDLAEGSADTTESGTATPPRRRTLITTLGVLTVVFALLAFWFQTNVHALRDQGPASNEAMVDRGTTSEVNGEVSDAIATLFSYDYADTRKTEDAAQELLVGRAVQEYDQLFATVKKQAPKQKLVVTTTVKDSGVTYLQGDRARVLLFVDQNASRNGQKGKVIPAQISVGVEKRGGQWKINQIIQR